MPEAYISSLLFSFIAVATMLGGGLIARIFPVTPKGESAIQHFAGGVVFAAVALELIPRLSGTVSKLDVAAGFLLGVACMLALKVFTHRLDEEEEKKGLSQGMTAGIVIDLLIDGVLIGLSFLAGKETGILIAGALAIETLSLGLALSVPLKNGGSPFSKAILYTGAIALAIPAGAAFSLFILDSLPSAFDTIMLSFGTAALLYLVTEELLLEAHERPDTSWVTGSFFLGFLVVLLCN